MAQLESLPDDVLGSVLQHLAEKPYGHAALAQLSQVNRRFRKLLRGPLPFHNDLSLRAIPWTQDSADGSRRVASFLLWLNTENQSAVTAKRLGIDAAPVRSLLLAHLGPQLQSLELDHSVQDLQQLADSLSCCTNLDRLTLRPHNRVGEGDHPREYSTVPWRKLQKLTVLEACDDVLSGDLGAFLCNLLHLQSLSLAVHHPLSIIGMDKL